MTRTPVLFSALVSALVLCAACATAPPAFAPGPERERRALDADEIDAIATLIQHEDLRRFEPEPFGALAGSSSVEVRRRTATAAGRIGDPAASGLLVALLGRDPNAAVRADAAFALGLLGDTSALVIDALRDAAPRDWIPVRPDETTVVVEAMAALGQLGTDQARTHLVEALRRARPAVDDTHALRIGAEALLAIWRVRPGPGRLNSVISFLDHPDPELRWRAALAAVRMGEPAAAARLLGLLDDPDHRVRALAARGLTATRADSAAIAPEAIAALSAAAVESHPHVRIAALGALGSFGQRAPRDVLAEALRDRDPNVAVAAAGSLAGLGEGSATPLAGFVADPAAPVGPAAQALALLADLDPERALPTIQEWAGQDRERRYGAARALGAVAWPRGAPLLERLVGDPDPRVAVAATVAAASAAEDLEATGPDRDRLRDLLLRAADADDHRQRPPALRALPPLLRAGDLPRILDIYQRSAADPAARLAAIAALRSLAAMQEAGIDAAPEFFRRFTRHEDRWIVRAADALGDGWGSAPPAAMAHERGFYVDIVRRYLVPALRDGTRPEAIVRTEQGDIRLELLADEAPLTVHNFTTLANAGVYDHGVWHRVVPGFVLQDGAPAGDPLGGVGWTIRDEINRVRYLRGTLGMAHSGPDTGGSQWFITHSPQPHLDGGYTIFGRVTGGERAMDRVVQGEAIHSVRVHH
jgi:cyclophilin family peptidyl-prolyl cis-trans isomerase/HEAT repeat protein